MGWFRKKDKQSQVRQQLIEKIDGKAVRYVTRREEVNGVTTETVLGKEGRINCTPEAVVIVCNGSVKLT